MAESNSQLRDQMQSNPNSDPLLLHSNSPEIMTEQLQRVRLSPLFSRRQLIPNSSQTANAAGNANNSSQTLRQPQESHISALNPPEANHYPSQAVGAVGNVDNTLRRLLGLQQQMLTLQQSHLSTLDQPQSNHRDSANTALNTAGAVVNSGNVVNPLQQMLSLQQQMLSLLQQESRRSLPHASLQPEFSMFPSQAIGAAAGKLNNTLQHMLIVQQKMLPLLQQQAHYLPALNPSQSNKDSKRDSEQTTGVASNCKQTAGGPSNSKQTVGGAEDSKQTAGDVSNCKQTASGASDSEQTVGGARDYESAIF